MSFFRKGTTFTLTGELIYTDNGTRVLNLTGYTFTAILMTPRTNRTIATLTTAFVDATVSTITISATAAETALWPDGDALLDITLTGSGGAPVTKGMPSAIRILP